MSGSRLGRGRQTGPVKWLSCSDGEERGGGATQALP